MSLFSLFAYLLVEFRSQNHGSDASIYRRSRKGVVTQPYYISWRMTRQVSTDAVVPSRLFPENYFPEFVFTQQLSKMNVVAHTVVPLTLFVTRH